jgi:predicted PurR-regulated permease PerM
MIVWGFLILLVIAVAVLIWLQFKNQSEQLQDLAKIQHLENKVIHLEDHLKRSLEIMQDLAKQVHLHQEGFEKASHKITQVELQNAELVNLLTKMIQPNDK